MRVLTKKSITDVTRRKLRAMLTVLGIAIGVMGLAAINIASDQLKASFQYTIDNAGAPDIQFATGSVDASLADTLAAQPHVTAVEASVTQPTRWSLASGHFPFRIIGLATFDAARFNKPEMVEGHLPGAGEILLESSDRSLATLHVGDSVTVGVRGQPQQLTISGFARTRGLPAANVIGLATGYMRQADAQALFATSGVNTFALKVDDTATEKNIAAQLASIFEAHKVPVLATTVGHSDGGASTILDGLFGLMRLLSIVALLLSVFLLLSTIMTLVTEQIPVIGTMKAIGAQGGKIVGGYLRSVALYGVIGTALGLALGVLGGYALVQFMGGVFGIDIGPLTISPWLIATAIAVGVGVPLVAAAAPVYLGTRLTVHQALSGYGLATSGRGSSAWWSRFMARVLGWVPQTMQLGARSLFRKRARAALTLMALAISGTAFLSVQTTAYSFDSFLGQLFGQYSANVFVSLSQPVSYQQARQTLEAVPGVDRAERLSQALVQTQYGQGVLTGVEPDAQLYHKQVLSGRWFTADDQNVLLVNEIAANKYGLKVGSTLAFHDDLHSATWTIIGIARDGNNPSGAGALLASTTQVNSYLRLPADYTSSLLIQSTSQRQADVDALAARIDETLSGAGYQATITTAQQQVQRNQSQFLILYVLLYSVAGIIALVGAIGLFNTLAMSVLERRREIGILRSMGATSRKVTQVFWTEGMTLGVLAWVLAIALGIPAAYGFLQILSNLLVSVPFAFNPLSLVWMLLFIVVVVAIASVGPVWGAGRVKIAQTLRYE